MDSPSKFRLTIAAIFVPLIMPVMIYATFLLIFGEDLDKDHGIKTSIRTACWVSYSITLALGVAGYIWMRVKGWRGVFRYMFMGIVMGFVSWLLFSLISLSLVYLLFFIFASAGFLMGLFFWFTVFFQPDGSHAHTRPGRRRRRRY